MTKKQIKDIQELLFKFPAFEFKGSLVTSCCENCVAENCLIEPSYLGLCSNYKFSEARFNNK